ncbi:MAG: DUF1918 domain-containing protein [Actinobacteria bacterium]|nr:DUF1918 domain-containing protein [Actinomycetota bacterium]
MSGKVGDRIQILGQNVGTPSREGEILEVVQGAVSVRYRVRWQDGHESVMSPSGGSALILPSSRKASKPQKAKTPAKASKASDAKKKPAR